MVEGPTESGDALAGVHAFARLAESCAAAVREAEGALSDTTAGPRRREAIRSTRRAIKRVRAFGPLMHAAIPPQEHARISAIDAVVELSSKANQLLGPLRDRDALVRSIQRISERFVEVESRRVVRTVLLATLVFAENDRRVESAFAEAAIERARRALRGAREAIGGVLVGPIRRGATEALLVRTYLQTHAEIKASLGEGDLARMHECRKKAAFVALALQPFGDAGAPEIRRLRSRARRLAAAIGEDRDLALLDVEMRAARSRLVGSPLLAAVDDAIRLARLEAAVRMEDRGRAFLRLDRSRTQRAIIDLA